MAGSPGHTRGGSISEDLYNRATVSNVAGQLPRWTQGGPLYKISDDEEDDLVTIHVHVHIGSMSYVLTVIDLDIPCITRKNIPKHLHWNGKLTSKF